VSSVQFKIVCVAGWLGLTALAFGQKPKVIVDQDGRGPGTTDMQSILMFAQSPDVDVLGFTMVSGDQWVKEETAHTLRVLEIAKRTDIPVFAGAENPLINSREESIWWDSRYGIPGATEGWTGDPGGKIEVHNAYHPPDVVPDLPEGMPTTKAATEHAVDFIIRMVHKYPGEVTIYAAGPLTNIALAIRMDPQVAGLAKQLVVMGGGFYGEEDRYYGRRELNWWFDPEAARIALSAPWKKIIITPLDVSDKTRMSEQIQSQIDKADTELTRYLKQYWRSSPMWDEIAAATVIDPNFEKEVITSQKEMYVNCDIDHGPNYGETIFIEKKDDTKLAPWWRLATVQFDLNTEKFYRMYIHLMTQPPGSGRGNGSPR
jgi:purine nucleosidase